MATPADGLAQLLSVLTRLEIQYFVGGSVASSAYGIPRTTMDVDLVVDLQPGQLDEFSTLLGTDFYVGESTLIHLPSTYKFDLFPLRADQFSRSEFDRRQVIEIKSQRPDPVKCAVSTAEDTILRKLEWYRAGGETSERQWNDLRGVLKVSGKILDYEYLHHWADYLKVNDLLDRLLAE